MQVIASNAYMPPVRRTARGITPSPPAAGLQLARHTGARHGKPVQGNNLPHGKRHRGHCILHTAGTTAHHRRPQGCHLKDWITFAIGFYAGCRREQIFCLDWKPYINLGSKQRVIRKGKTGQRTSLNSLLAYGGIEIQCFSFISFTPLRDNSLWDSRSTRSTAHPILVLIHSRHR